MGTKKTRNFTLKGRWRKRSQKEKLRSRMRGRNEREEYSVMLVKRGHVKKEWVVSWKSLHKLQEDEKWEGATEFCKWKFIRDSKRAA